MGPVDDLRSTFDDMMAGNATDAEVSEAIDKVQDVWTSVAAGCSVLEGFFCDGVVAWSLLTKENMATAHDAMLRVRRLTEGPEAKVCVYHPAPGGMLRPTCGDFALIGSSVAEWKFCPWCGGEIEVWKAVPREG